VLLTATPDRQTCILFIKTTEMAHFKRTASAVWRGTGPDGAGELNGPSGVLDNTPYSAKLRFQNEDGKAGTNPEELIAAAHAGCFIMALSFQLTNAGFTPTELNCSATIDMEKGDSGWGFQKITLDLQGAVPGISEEKFLELANAAKAGCPVSKALSAVPVELVARLG
jgi:lipoyl-dependent peroxiredoxin